MIDALSNRIPGLAEAQADKILKARQHDVVAMNDDLLANAMVKDLNPPPLLDPFSDAVNSTPYDGGAYHSGGAATGGE
jgi:hypothetical protein